MKRVRIVLRSASPVESLHRENAEVIVIRDLYVAEPATRKHKHARVFPREKPAVTAKLITERNVMTET
jgi:hypothetical protein